jgi:hypothetical protein
MLEAILNLDWFNLSDMTDAFVDGSLLRFVQLDSSIGPASKTLSPESGWRAFLFRFRFS